MLCLLDQVPNQQKNKSNHVGERPQGQHPRPPLIGFFLIMLMTKSWNTCALSGCIHPLWWPCGPHIWTLQLRLFPAPPWTLQVSGRFSTSGWGTGWGQAEPRLDLQLGAVDCRCWSPGISSQVTEWAIEWPEFILLYIYIIKNFIVGIFRKTIRYIIYLQPRQFSPTSRLILWIQSHLTLICLPHIFALFLLISPPSSFRDISEINHQFHQDCWYKGVFHNDSESWR